MAKALPAGQLPLTVEELGGAGETERPQPMFIAPDGRVIDEEAIDRAVAKAQAKAIQRVVDRVERRDQLRVWRSGR
jgi:hypothetical protein